MNPFSPEPQEEPLVRIILKRFSRHPKRILLVLGIILFAGAFFYFSSRKTLIEPQNLPVIKAPPGPSRLKPESDKNPLVPHQSRQVYKNLEKPSDASASAKIEHLLSPVEEPLPFEVDPGEDLVKNDPAREEKQIEKNQASPIQSIDQLLGRTTLQQPAEPEIRKGGKYRLQLGSLPTREAAEQEWKRIQRLMKEPIFTRLRPLFERIDLGAQKGGIVYRIILENIASKESAKIFESRLKEKNIGCLIIAP